MGRKLVIVESPAKAKTINKILGPEYVVKASMGHVRDLPVKTLGVDVKNGFKPRYTVVGGRKKTVEDLKNAAAACDVVYLAQDPDREGEAIAWHLKALLDRSGDRKEFKRVQYNEITARAVRHAFEQPRDIDMHLVDAQQARRILDRIVGYTVSPMLWRRIKRGLSAGRVQSVALRLVCEREAEIRGFVPQEYWLMGALVRKLAPPLDPFTIRLAQIAGQKADIKSREQTENIKADLDGRILRVAGIATKEVSRRAPPPFITSTLQQAGSTFCGYSPNRTMSIAQKLYEGVELGEGPVGLITYMRTDSFTVAQEALNSCRDYIREMFGDEYCPDKPNYFKNRATAQEAHEAIRPTDVRRTPESIEGKVDPSLYKLYSLIWKRFVASQMAPARIGQRTATVDAVPDASRPTTYSFRATASEIIFAGYTKVAGSDIPLKDDREKGDDDSVERLPQLAEGEELKCVEWLAERKETQPPSRYSEASLIRALEAEGVGRPSTYAQIISTLHNRNYVSLDKRSLVPTDLGMQVSNLLVSVLGDLFNVRFTASMEDSLDEIEKGAVEWTKMMEDFYRQFEGWMVHTQEPPADRAVVERVLGALALVKEWAPPVKQGKRTFSDGKFVESVRKQLQAGKKEISTRQLETLVRIAIRYREQAPEIETVINDAGCANILTAQEREPASEATLRKLDILSRVELNEGARSFTNSLQARVSGGRNLSGPQVNALNNVVLAHAARIENFDGIRSELDLGGGEPVDDRESGPLLEALKSVKTWNAPVTRGRRVFDDEAFYGSLAQHYARKSALSQKQIAALKKIVARYSEQIPGYETLAETFGLRKRPVTQEPQPDA